MSATTQFPPSLPPGPVRRFTVDEYHRMIETGVLTDGEPYELLEGWIVSKMAHNPRHAGAIQRTARRLSPVVPAGWVVRIQLPISLSDSEPEPDVAVVVDDGVDYTRRHPGPADVALIVEVANTSLAFDRSVTARIYARAGIPAYWVVNVVDRRVEAFTDPDSTAEEPAYRSRRDVPPGETLPLVLGGATVAELPAVDLLPPAA